ncbi:hypothetical protein JIX56_03345 [Streptomyces sp. CA-210063]|uniref:PepSY domain-containing protein n=1 Tax=Streptomyces sp. CA-210063 TaxID=2801029 RepID=UPI00214B0009|nr:hypothetical protein [Streptomyces sp. CA-210063]UUU29009.1 hypothetical protein JIX56_03345 [Streptomyces sp. CA-210063]
MKRKGKWIVGAVLSAALIGGGTGIAVSATGGDDTETSISGPALGKASAAALAYTGGGEVTDSEVGDEEGSYEVEVTLDNGKQADVHLDKDFKVLGSEVDGGDEPNDKD